MKKKPSKLLASITAAALAVMSAVVVVPGVEVSAAEVSLDVDSTENMVTVSAADLDKYDSFTFTYEPKKAAECSHKVKDPLHGAETAPTYCTWSGVNVAAAAELDGTTNWWIETGLKAETLEDAASCTASLTKAAVLEKIKATDAWKKATSADLIKVMFKGGDCTITSAKGTVSGSYVELKADEWTKTAEGTYAIQGNSKKETPAKIKIPVADLLPEGKTVADIESVTAKFEIIGGAANGDVGYNDSTVTDPDSQWKSAAWSESAADPITVTTAVDFTDILVQVYWLNENVKVTAKYTVKCKEGTESDKVTVTVTPATKTLKVGETAQLTATVTGKDDAVVTWTSSDTKVATVDADGKVTAAAKGTATITAAVGDVKATAAVTVEEAAEDPKPDDPKPDDPKPDAPKVDKPVNNTGIAVAADDKAILNAVALTDAEKAQGVTLQLKVENAVLDTAAAEAVNKAASDKDKDIKVSDTALDIKLVKTVGTETSEVKTLVSGKTIPVTITVPAALIKEGREFFVIHYHDGKADILTGVLADGKFTFDVSGFSAFVLAYKDKATEPAPTPTPTENTVWSGSQELDWDNGKFLQLAIGDYAKLADVKAGDTIKVTFSGEGQIQFNALDSNWGWVSFASPELTAGVADVSGGTFSITVTDADKVENGIALNGKGVTLTMVELIHNGGTTPVDPTPKPEEAEPTYPVTVSGYATVTGDRTAGSEMTVSMPIGFVARVYNGNTLIATIWDSGKFTMPAGSVYINVTDESGAGMMAYTAPNSYIFSYKSDMTLIKTTRSKKGIRGTGEITVKLGAEYAGKTVTLYSGKKSTANKITEAELDSKGCATFTVEGAKNYTLVVED